MADGSRRVWWAIGLLTSILVCYMPLPFVDVLIYGIFVYYVARPVYGVMRKMIRSDSLSVFLSLFLVILPVIVIALYAASVASFELSRLLEGVDYSIPIKYLSDAVDSMSLLGQQLTPQELWDLINSSGGLDLLIVPVTILLDVSFKLFLTLTIGYYLIKDGRRLREWATGALFPGEDDLGRRFFDSLDANLRGIFAGTVLVAVMTSFVAIVLFYTMDSIAPASLVIPYPFLLGLLCGIAIFVPGIGVAIIWVPIVIYLIVQAYFGGVLLSAAWFLLLFAVAVFLFVGVAPDLLLRPLISSKNMHPGIMLCSYIFGYAVFGFVGLFLGPLIVAAASSFAKVVLPAIRD
jgi:predicted PurR-regulated permease PerM